MFWYCGRTVLKRMTIKRQRMIYSLDGCDSSLQLQTKRFCSRHISDLSYEVFLPVCLPVCLFSLFSSRSSSEQLLCSSVIGFA